MAQNDAIQHHGGVCSRHARPRVGLTADLAAQSLMRIMMAASAELISANSILMKTHLLYHFNQFGRARDAWRACRKFGFGDLPKLPWHTQFLGNFRQFSAAGDEKICILVTWLLNEFGTQWKSPWQPWHFSILEGPVTRDCRIEWNGTVYPRE